MATEEQKKRNMLRLARLTLYGLTTGIWDLIGEGSTGLSHVIGDEILPVMEKEMGLEVAGENPVDVLTELARVLVDEFGFAQDIEVSGDDDKITVKVKGCAQRKLADDLTAFGIAHLFSCPILCVGDVVLDRLGVKAMGSIARWEEGKGSIITYELI